MTHQAPLIPSRHTPDIWKKYRLPSSRFVNEAAWEDARRQKRAVGTCHATAPTGKQCGGDIEPGQPYAAGARRMFPAVCATCGHETAAPGPAPARKRTRR